MAIPVVALYGPLNALFNIYLANRVSGVRRQAQVSIGLGQHKGADKALEVAVRVHGNNAEFVPLAIVMLLLAELSGGSSMWLHIAGGSLLVARIMHMIGMPRRAPNVFRFAGTGVTWTVITALSVWTLVLRSSAAG